MELRIFQKGFNYSQDGIGNRLVYHLQGCNLQCPWCSNPEGMDLKSRNTFSVTAENIVEEVLRCRPMFFDGGGVTFTGGEATCQFEALANVLALLKQEKISTALETNGTSPHLPELFVLLDELIIDCKHYDSDVHRKFTGLGNERIKANIKAAFEKHPNILVRIPLIGVFNASEKDIEGFMAFFAENDTSNARFELLRYHEYGKDKWEKCGKAYKVHDAFVSEESRNHYEDIMRSHGLHVVRT